MGRGSSKMINSVLKAGVKSAKKIEVGDELYVKQPRYKGQNQNWTRIDQDGTVISNGHKIQTNIKVTDVKRTQGTITITGEFSNGYTTVTVKKKFNTRDNKTFYVKPKYR